MLLRRTILLATAFAALLLVVGVSTAAIWWNASRAQSRATELQATHFRVDSALSQIRSDVLLTGLLTREFLLLLRITPPETYRSRFETIRATDRAAFEILTQTTRGPDQLAIVSELEANLTEHNNRRLALLDAADGLSRGELASQLNGLAREREDLSMKIEKVEDLFTDNLLKEQRESRDQEVHFRNSTLWIIGLSLLFGLGISIFTLNRMVRLERNSVMAETELRQLTGQLRTAQELERKNLSRELHDQVGQMLTGLRMELSSVVMHLAPGSEPAQTLNNSKRTVEGLIGNVRNISLLLRPSMLDDLGLRAALTWLAKEVSRTSGISVRSNVDTHADALPDSYRTCIYRVVQEALTNVTRHSGATTAEVSLRTVSGWISVEVADDGHGFALNERKNRGLGLIGMEERVKELGGSFRVNSAPHGGTQVAILLPHPDEVSASSAGTQVAKGSQAAAGSADDSGSERREELNVANYHRR